MTLPPAVRLNPIEEQRGWALHKGQTAQGKPAAALYDKKGEMITLVPLHKVEVLMEILPQAF